MPHKTSSFWPNIVQKFALRATSWDLPVIELNAISIICVVNISTYKLTLISRSKTSRLCFTWTFWAKIINEQLDLNLGSSPKILSGQQVSNDSKYDSKWH